LTSILSYLLVLKSELIKRAILALKDCPDPLSNLRLIVELESIGFDGV
jgi:hypothetical protein